MSESVPSSVTGFAHRRPRSDSVASFTYFQEDDESPEWSDDQALAAEEDDSGSPAKYADNADEIDLESATSRSARRKYSGLSRSSIGDPLLPRRASVKSNASGFRSDPRRSQKLYIISEDMTIAVAGFGTRRIGAFVYIMLCICTCGLVYLALRWLPRWKVVLVGSSKPLRDCDWVVLEVRSPNRWKKSRTAAKQHQNQWGEMSIQSLTKIPLDRVTETLYGSRTSKARFSHYEDDEDLQDIAFLDYRYMRFWFDQMNDKFVPCNDWVDPKWCSLEEMGYGLDSEERAKREAVFGKNQIEIHEKTIPQLLVAEVELTFSS